MNDQGCGIDDGKHCGKLRDLGSLGKRFEGGKVDHEGHK
jgi:hypothetical protein